MKGLKPLSPPGYMPMYDRPPSRLSHLYWLVPRARSIACDLLAPQTSSQQADRFVCHLSSIMTPVREPSANLVNTSHATQREQNGKVRLEKLQEQWRQHRRGGMNLEKMTNSDFRSRSRYVWAHRIVESIRHPFRRERAQSTSAIEYSKSSGYLQAYYKHARDLTNTSESTIAVSEAPRRTVPETGIPDDTTSQSSRAAPPSFCYTRNPALDVPLAPASSVANESNLSAVSSFVIPHM
jgi:hypothetical protein